MEWNCCTHQVIFPQEEVGRSVAFVQDFRYHVVVAIVGCDLKTNFHHEKNQACILDLTESLVLALSETFVLQVRDWHCKLEHLPLTFPRVDPTENRYS